MFTVARVNMPSPPLTVPSVALTQLESFPSSWATASGARANAASGLLASCPEQPAAVTSRLQCEPLTPHRHGVRDERWQLRLERRFVVDLDELRRVEADRSVR